jgi:hypothetical protein
MTTSSREPASAGGRDHRNPWPASIGTGGRLRSESTADFVGMRNLIDVENAIIVDVEATTAIRQAEVLAAKRMIERSLDRFDL